MRIRLLPRTAVLRGFAARIGRRDRKPDPPSVPTPQPVPAQVPGVVVPSALSAHAQHIYDELKSALERRTAEGA